MTASRLAVVTPFLDKRHGTERCVAEQVERLARVHGWSVHVYSQRVEDVPLTDGQIVWRRVPRLPGPHVFNYVWWFAGNHLVRWWDRLRGRGYDLLYSPGINCLDADVISVHIVFREFHRQVRDSLSLRRNPLVTWPRLVHRRVYYWLIMMLERLVYPRRHVSLAAISVKTAGDLARFYGRDGDVAVSYYGIDTGQFNPEARQQLRQAARAALSLPESAFVFLLVGNDWKKKGLEGLLEAVARLKDPTLWVLVAGRDDPALFRDQIVALGLVDRVRFLPPRPDVEAYYAAADCYVGPSLEDAFALPPAEAMACGLPVIVSAQAGASEIVTDDQDALVLKDPRDVDELPRLLLLIRQDADLRRRLGDEAVKTARRYTWDRNAAEIAAILHATLEKRGRR